jgi:hypothetical protein
MLSSSFPEAKKAARGGGIPFVLLTHGRFFSIAPAIHHTQREQEALYANTVLHPPRDHTWNAASKHPECIRIISSTRTPECGDWHFFPSPRCAAATVARDPLSEIKADENVPLDCGPSAH